MPKLSYYRKKADRTLENWGKRKYKHCLICDAPIACLHHYYPKSVSAALRYDEDNLIPLCHGCHIQHHNGNPEIHNTVNKILGDKWLKRLKGKKHNIIKPSQKYYKEIIKKYAESQRVS